MLVKIFNELPKTALWHTHLISQWRQRKARLKFAFQLYCHLFKAIRQTEAFGQISFGVLSSGKAEVVEVGISDELEEFDISSELEEFFRKARKFGQTWKEQSS